MGIYFHIPFCKQACHYCDFHFSTNLKLKDDMVNAMLQEIQLRKNEIEAKPIETIYFGGGTPSLLSANDVNLLIGAIAQHNALQYVKEITFEVNPDDITEAYIKKLQNTPINRFSVGVQSFFNQDLLWMNRSHTAEQAVQSIKLLQNAGYTNINIDLIYGSPTTTNELWISNVEFWDSLNIPHLSAYALTVEKNTALHTLIKKGVSKAPNDEKTNFQFDYLMAYAKQKNIDHYEISNFCKNGKYSLHNTNYWFNKAYFGVGPSAHSYNGKDQRKWNISNNVKYMENVLKNHSFSTSEQLSENEQMNEYLLTRLRTKWGINKKDFSQRFTHENWDHLMPQFEKMEMEGFVIDQGDRYRLSQKGMHFADGIASDLFF